MRVITAPDITVSEVGHPRARVLLLPPERPDRGDVTAMEALGHALRDVGLSATGVDGPTESAEPAPHCGLISRIARIRSLLADINPSERTVLVGYCYGALVAGLAAARDPRITDVVALTPPQCFAFRELRQRILFVAGDRDTVSPAPGVQELFEECGSTDKELKLLPGVEHDYRHHSDQLDLVIRTVLEWIDKAPR